MPKTRLNDTLRYKIRSKIVPTIGVIEQEAAEQAAFDAMHGRMLQFLAESGPSDDEKQVMARWGCMVEATQFGRYAIPHPGERPSALTGDERIDTADRRQRVVTVFAAPRDVGSVPYGRMHDADFYQGRRRGSFYVPHGWSPTLPDKLIDLVAAYYDAMSATNRALIEARRAFASVLHKARTVEALVEAFPPCAELVEEFKRQPPRPVDTSILARCKVTAPTPIVEGATEDDGDDGADA